MKFAAIKAQMGIWKYYVTKEHLYLFVPRNAYRYGRQIYESLAHYLDDGENLYDTCS